MEKEGRTVVYDRELELEACRFCGMDQKFPMHFHEYYVIGFVEAGRRDLCCNGENTVIEPGDLVIFNPGDSHGCLQLSGELLDWRSLNIKKEVVAAAVAEIAGRGEAPAFAPNVIRNGQLAARLRDLHQLILEGHTDFEREEQFYFFLEELVEGYAKPKEGPLPELSEEIARACAYMEENYGEPIGLETLCKVSGLGKYTLLRHFVRQRGMTPYQYLETIRIGEAKKLLEAGVGSAEAGARTGFSDQSHFTRFFKTFIGLTPGQYQSIFQKP